MKRTFEVRINTLKIEPDKDGILLRHVYLELPNVLDLHFFKQAHRISSAKKPRTDETVTFTMTVEDHLTGEVSTFSNWTSKGSKTKDFVLCAHLMKMYSPIDQMEEFIFQLDTRLIKLHIEVESPLFPDRIEKVFQMSLNEGEERAQA